MTETQQIIAEMKLMIARARVRFFREALPLAGDDEEMLKLVRSIAAAIPEVSPEEGITVLRRELAAKVRR